MNAEILDFAQASLALVTAAGVGGIWYRLGHQQAKSEALDKRVGALEVRIATVEKERISHAHNAVLA